MINFADPTHDCLRWYCLSPYIVVVLVIIIIIIIIIIIMSGAKVHFGPRSPSQSSSSPVNMGPSLAYLGGSSS